MSKETENIVNLKVTKETRALAKKVAALKNSTLFDWVNDVVKDTALAQLESMGIRLPDEPKAPKKTAKNKNPE